MSAVPPGSRLANSRAVASIGVCSPASRMDDSRLSDACALVIDIAGRLSLQLGGASRIARDENDGKREDRH